MAYLLIRVNDHDKYGTIKRRLEYQFYLDNDHYPTNIVEIVDALNNHKFEI